MVLNSSNPPSKLYCLTWSEFSSSLTTTAQNLRNVQDLTDVTISAGGKIFPAHKLVLSAASPLLMDLLKNTKCQHPILMLAGISAVDFETILDFVYKGEINIDSDKLPSLLQAASLLDIRALSPAALVLNSLENAILTPTTVDKDTTTDQSTVKPISANALDEKNNNHKNYPSKRKPTTKQEVPNSKAAKTSFVNVSNSASQTYNVKHADEAVILAPASPPEPSIKMPVHVNPNGTENQEGMPASICDEKKIISDLPVNCKLCGVTIRQSRNLRRHIDQMHSKKLKPKEIKRKERHPLVNRNHISKSSTEAERNSGTSSPLIDDFSQDSFSQLTEEILNYSAGSESDESSFSNTITISSSSMNTLMENVKSVSSTGSTTSSIVRTQSLPTLLEDDICFQLSAKNNSSSTISSETRGKAVEQFECSNLDDSCHVNDIALKELENQLFSACFCSTENV